ncbi:MAG: hypothetical protein MRJ93_10505 [Nitrososphaeraceae archaeon]|nr:hypothetical protein [Nitrososphaeraceae archaeon]
MTSEIPRTVCEICGQNATAGILDNEVTNNNDRNIQIRIRYSCLDHYLQVYQKIQGERKFRLL